MSSSNTDIVGMENLQRPSLRVAVAAAVLQVNISTIYKLARSGVLQAHRIGKRGVRIFADSLREYQENQTIVICDADSKKRSVEPRKSRRQSHEHKKALILLRQIGVI